MDTLNTGDGTTIYMTVAAMENYVPVEVFNLALQRLQELEKVVDALPDYTEIPLLSRVTTVSENANGDYFLRWSASDPANRDMQFFLKVGVEDFKRIYPISNNGFYTYVGSNAPRGSNPSYIKVSNGTTEIISDVFNIMIPEDPNAKPPHIDEIGNIRANVNEVIKITYVAYDENSEITKHEFSDDGGTYDITNSVLKMGNKYMYTLSYSNIADIKKAYITVYDADGMRTKSNDFSITVVKEPEKPSLVEFEIVPLKYKTTVDTIEIQYKTDKPLQNVKLSLNGDDFISANIFNQEKAVFSVKGIANGTYNAKLRGYYKEDVRSV